MPMPDFRFYRAWALAIVFCLSWQTLAQEKTVSDNSAEEAALYEVIKKYYAAYEQKNLWAMVKLWSDRSPDLVASIDRADKSLASEQYAFANITISKIKVTNEKAILQAAADTTVTNL